MLTLLITLVGLSSRVSSAPISNGSTRGFVSEPDGRGTIGIMTSCICTLIICLWTCLHLHIPPPSVTFLGVIARKLRWLVIGAIAPEVMAATALGQYFCVKDQVRRINSLAGMSQVDKWSITDGFYTNMGGYVLSVPNRPRVVLSINQLISLVQANLITVPPSSLQAIKDKSKADGFAKGLACIQASWFVLSSLARTLQSLPITTLELSTIAYVFFAILIYAFLWHKPLDIRVPTSITLLKSTDDIKQNAVLESLLYNSTDGEEDKFSSEYYLIPYRSSKKHNLNDSRLLPRSFIIAPILGVMYGIWHCIAWEFYFPSEAEKILWHVCVGLTTALLPLIFGTASLEEYLQRHRVNERGLCRVSLVLLGGIYCIARIAMIMEMFLGLRSLPSGVFDTVQWSDYIPHL